MASPRGRGPTIDSKIREAFNLIDTDNSGTIDVAELTVRSPRAEVTPSRFATQPTTRPAADRVAPACPQHAMTALGLKPDPAEAKRLMDSVDEDKSGSIDFQEFRKMMTSKMRVLEAGKAAAADDLGSLIALSWEELKASEPGEDDFSLPARKHRLAVYSRKPDWKLDEAVAAYTSPRARTQN
jgi:hypothetical protein